MRKYQQLLLVVVSVLSVAILLMYRNENSKLKYILEVVNFFGRTDSQLGLVRIENSSLIHPSLFYNFAEPVPMWTRIGNGFHCYSSFWHKNDFSSGGEAISLVIGLQISVVNYRCSFQYSDGHIANGLFSYNRVETTGPITSKNMENFLVYKFLCKANRDFKSYGPETVIFRDSATGSDHFMPVKDLTVAVVQDSDKVLKNKLDLAICIDLVPYNLTREKNFHRFTEREILEYFIHHKLVGLDAFIVYETNSFPTKYQDLLNRLGIRINKLPYNFPFELMDDLKNRVVIEMDCLLRTSTFTKHVILSRLNEYFIPTNNLKRSRAFDNSLSAHPTNINRMEMNLNTICIPEHETDKSKILSDYHNYERAAISDHTFYVYKPTYELQDKVKSIHLDRTSGVINRYLKHCPNKTAELLDWRKSMTEDQLEFVQSISKEIKRLLN